MQLKTIKQTQGVVNFVYWLAKPLVIKNDEIQEIKQFVSDHENIKLEKIEKNINDTQPVIDKSLMTMEEKMIPIKNKTMKTLHTSLGFSMIAEINQPTREIIYKEKKNDFLKHYKKLIFLLIHNFVTVRVSKWNF